MKKKLLIICLGLSWIGSGVMMAQQDVWTLEKCISYALEQNITVRKSILSNQQLEISAEQTRAQRFPSVSGSAGTSLGWGSEKGFFGDPANRTGSNGTNFSVSSNISVFNGFKLQNQIRQSAMDIESGKLSLETTKESISLSILNAFLQVLYAQEQVKNAEKQIESTTEQVNLANERYNLQVISQADFSQVKSQLASEKLTLANAQSQLAIARVNLMQLMELPVTNDFAVADPDLEASLNQNRTPDVQSVFSKALEIKPQIKNAAINKDIAALDEKIARAGYLPSLSASAGISTNAGINFDNNFLGSANAPYFEELNKQFRPSVGLSLSIPIYQKKQVKTSVSLARISYQNAELSEIDTKNQLRKNIEQACQDVSSAQIKYEASVENYNATKEASSLSDEKFTQGIINSVDYLVSKTNLIVAESQLLQSKYNLIFSYKILDFYLGVPLSL